MSTPATRARPLLAQPPEDPTRLQFRAGAAGADLGKIDREAGTIAGVSLLTADREASGWGLWIDAKTLDTFRAVMGDRRIKAYATHGCWGKDGTLDEVGFWRGTRIDATHLRADFQGLASWRKHDVAEFDKLFELAEVMPGEFGASLSFRFRAVWIRTNGEEVETVRKWRYLPNEGYEEYWEPSMPADAVRDMPSVRATEVFSADFVDTPAANSGLFRSSGVDASAKGAPSNSPTSGLTSSFAMLKEINAKFGSNPALLARAIHFHTADDKATFAQVCASVEAEQTATEVARLRGVETEHTAFTGALDKAGFKAVGDKPAITILIEEHASFKAKAAAHDAGESALKAAGFEAKDGKSAVELALAALKKERDTIAALRAGGTPPVETSTSTNAADAAGQLTGARRAGAAWNAKFAAQKAGNN